ncbi:MAG: ACT domain-containing protein, partial [Roseovarius confluentis]
VMDIARGVRLPTFGIPATDLGKPATASEAAAVPYYLRMALHDKPGALAKVATILGNAGVSIDRMRQYRHEEATAPVLIVTHKTAPSALASALEALSQVDVVASSPVALRIESV